ncbi:MAG: GatB/YqeY domain-containing protein [Patescibacteria group bacterium]
MLQEKIAADMKKAMIAKDPTRVTVLRGLMAAFTNELVSKMKKPTDPLAEEDAVAVVSRASKQRKDSIEQFTKGGRADLADSEKIELAILEEYLPKMMSRDEIRPLATAKATELGIAAGAGNKSKMGQFVGAIMKDLKGKADGGDVKAVVEEILG